MADELKPKIENLEKQQEKELTPEEAEAVQGGNYTSPQNVSTQKAFEIKDFSFGVENST